MKKLLVLMLALSLSITLVACNSTKEDIYEVGDQSTNVEFKTLLEEVKNDVQPGTAGCSLKAISVAVGFMNFYNEEVNDEDALKDFDEFYGSLTDEEKEIFDEAWGMVYNEIITFYGSDKEAEVKEKLDLAGKLDDMNYPWSEEPIELYKSIDSKIAE